MSLPVSAQSLTLAYRDHEFAAGAPSIRQNHNVCHLAAETGFIEFKGWCPFKKKKKMSAAIQ